MFPFPSCRRTRFALLFLAFALGGASFPCAPATAGEGWWMGAGIAAADVGLHESRLGATVSVGRILPLPDPRFDFGFAGEYVQKAGNQPRLFTPAEGTQFVGDEEIRLHYLQPSFSFGYVLPLRTVRARTYVGAAMALKVSEAWTRPVEDGLERLGYEDTDFTVHLGASLAVGSLALDLRYAQGLVSQLIVTQTQFPTEKADDPLADVDEPEDGARLDCWRLGAVWEF